VNKWGNRDIYDATLMKITPDGDIKVQWMNETNSFSVLKKE